MSVPRLTGEYQLSLCFNCLCGCHGLFRGSQLHLKWQRSIHLSRKCPPGTIQRSIRKHGLQQIIHDSLQNKRFCPKESKEYPSSVKSKKDRNTNATLGIVVYLTHLTPHWQNKILWFLDNFFILSLGPYIGKSAN